MTDQKRKKRVCCWSKSSFDFLSSAKAKTYDEKSLQQVNRVLLFKLRMFLVLRLILYVLNVYSANYFIKEARLLQDNNFVDVDLELQKMILPSVEVIVFLGNVVKLVILLLTYKWPELARVAFPFDLFITFVYKLVPYYD